MTSLKIICLLIVVLFPFNYVFFSNLIGISNLGGIYHFLWYGSFRGNAEPSSQLKLVSCGWSRTGTISMKIGLERVGYKCYHGGDNWYHGHSKKWLNAFNDTSALDDILEEILSMGYDTMIDLPQVLFCPYYIQKYPDAKVLITVRDDEDAWYQSFSKVAKYLSVYANERFPLWFFKDDGWVKVTRRILEHQNISYHEEFEESVFPWVNGKYINPTKTEIGEKSAKRAYLEHIQKVSDLVEDKSKLLVFNVKQGWGPLLDFLEIEDEMIRNSAFPRVNQGEIWDVVFFLTRLVLRVFPFLIVMDLWILFLCGRKLFMCSGGDTVQKNNMRLKSE